jgi:hypothetical protein
MRGLLLCALALAVAPVANGQIVYEPVQYQYGGQNPYSYGGQDPRVHVSARHPHAPGTTWGRGNGFAFRSAGVHTHREVVTERPRVFTDALPYRNAFVYGFTVNDARNEAYARVPTYFRKADLLRSARPDDCRGGWVVPADAPRGWECRPGQIIIRPMVRRTTDSVREARPVLIIPKDLLDAPRDEGDSTLRDPLLSRAD